MDLVFFRDAMIHLMRVRHHLLLNRNKHHAVGSLKGFHKLRHHFVTVVRVSGVLTSVNEKSRCFSDFINVKTRFCPISRNTN